MTSIILRNPPRILVFNPLTGGKKYIGISSFIASIDKEEMYAMLPQIIMDVELGCYKLILVTLRRKPNYGRTIYFSESYDSVSGVWSTLDSGFVCGDGVLVEERCHVCFDCGLKKICTPRELYFGHYPTTRPFYTFVRDHCFKLRLVGVEADGKILSFMAEISESVFQNGWNEKDTILQAVEMPYEDFDARLLVCTHYVLVIADFSDIDFEGRHRMVLHDKETGKVVCDIPQILDRHEFHTSNDFMDRDLQFMCDLKWHIVP
ncbi:hypothetical protein M758_9G052500 [Ceratodon purpureus]|nr:hypothetical protein M758_9G052500 [Ceratodon purpureus]